MNLNDYIQKRAEKETEQARLLIEAKREKRELNKVETRLWDELAEQISVLDNIINEETINQERNKREARKTLNRNFNPRDDQKKSFHKWMVDTMEGKTVGDFKLRFDVNSPELRADPILTTTNTDLILKTVDRMNTNYSSSQMVLENMGVTILTGLQGDYVLPILDERTAVFVNENEDVSTANMSPENLILKNRRVGLTQSISKQALLSYNSNTMEDIYINLENAVWNAIADDLFDNLDTDASEQISTFSGNISLTDITNMEASLGTYNLVRPAYVVRPETKAYLKRTNELETEFIWNKDNTVNGYNAFATPSVNTGRVYFGDWSKAIVGIWGEGIEVIVNPFTEDSKGIIRLTINAFVDTTIRNPKSFVIMADASTLE